jgi:hypothetical protein
MMAVGALDGAFTLRGYFIVSSIFSVNLTWKDMIASFICGYAVLWIINLDIIKE